MRKFILTLAMLAMTANMAWAANIYKGIISEVFDGGQSIKVSQIDELTKEKKILFVSIDSQTQIVGTPSSATLKTGDAVEVTATETGFNHLSAQNIAVTSNP